MPAIELKGDKVPINIWAPLHEVESQALNQLKNISSLPWVYHHVAAMPDCHFGIGATVGSVVAMKNAVSPSAVGVDIGCGVIAAQFQGLTSTDLPDHLHRMRSEIEKRVPVGFSWHDTPVTEGLGDSFQECVPEALQSLQKKAELQCGTLGGGNHFIEVCLDSEDGVWIMLHSGSRNIGKEIADNFIRIAKDLPHNRDITSRDLSVFLNGTPEMEAYRKALYWAQDYARKNREVMLSLTKAGIARELRRDHLEFTKVIQCHHNYVAEEVHYGEEVFVTRKGAIRAEKGDLGIIPGSMGTGSYIVRGLGNPESFNSASHGAGRRMSRGAAKKTFTVADLIKQTEGVECRKDRGILDEIPGAYKNLETVMENQSDLVEVITKLNTVLCVKG